MVAWMKPESSSNVVCGASRHECEYDQRAQQQQI
jgi:hypothetical protein